MVQRFFQTRKFSLTLDGNAGYAGLLLLWSQHLETDSERRLAEILASHSPLGDAACVVVPRFFQTSRFSLTLDDNAGYAGFRLLRSQHLETESESPIAEVLANHGPVGDAAYRVAGQVCRRLHPQLGR